MQKKFKFLVIILLLLFVINFYLFWDKKDIMEEYPTNKSVSPSIENQEGLEKETFITFLSEDTIQVRTFYYVNTYHYSDYISDFVDINSTINKDTISVILNKTDILDYQVLKDDKEISKYVQADIPKNTKLPFEIEFQFEVSCEKWFRKDTRETAPEVYILFPGSVRINTCKIFLISKDSNFYPVLTLDLDENEIFKSFSPLGYPFENAILLKTDKPKQYNGIIASKLTFKFKESFVSYIEFKEDITIFPGAYTKEKLDFYSELNSMQEYFNFTFELGSKEGIYTLEKINIIFSDQSVREPDRVHSPEELEKKAEEGRAAYLIRNFMDRKIIQIFYKAEGISAVHFIFEIQDSEIKLEKIKYYEIKEYAHKFHYLLGTPKYKWDITIQIPSHKILKTNREPPYCLCDISEQPESCSFNFEKLEETKEGLVLRIVSINNFQNMLSDKETIKYLQFLLILSFVAVGMSYFSLAKFKNKWTLRILKLGKDSYLNKFAGLWKNFPSTTLLSIPILISFFYLFFNSNERLFVYLNSLFWFYFLLLVITIIIDLKFPLKKKKKRKKK